MSWTEIALRLGAAALIGAAIGLDRELRHKSAGVRTIGLVTLGAAMATLIVTYTAADSIDAVSRVIQGAVTGIGFLGAGVIVRHRGSVEGLTTAAAIWTAAVLGAATGLGQWPLALFGSVFAFALLVLAGWAEHTLKRSKPLE